MKHRHVYRTELSPVSFPPSATPTSSRTRPRSSTAAAATATASSRSGVNRLASAFARPGSEARSGGLHLPQYAGQLEAHMASLAGGILSRREYPAFPSEEIGPTSSSTRDSTLPVRWTGFRGHVKAARPRGLTVVRVDGHGPLRLSLRGLISRHGSFGAVESMLEDEGKRPSHQNYTSAPRVRPKGGHVLASRGLAVNAMGEWSKTGMNFRDEVILWTRPMFHCKWLVLHVGGDGRGGNGTTSAPRWRRGGLVLLDSEGITPLLHGAIRVRP